jgi:hypothetical protein
MKKISPLWLAGMTILLASCSYTITLTAPLVVPPAAPAPVAQLAACPRFALPLAAELPKVDELKFAKADAKARVDLLLQNVREIRAAVNHNQDELTLAYTRYLRQCGDDTVLKNTDQAH